LAVRETSNDNEDIWIKELDDGPRSRLTFDDAEDWSPHWTPDGERVTFVSNRDTDDVDDRNVWTKRADGTGEAELLYDHEGLIVEGFWGPDGEWLVLRGGSFTAGQNTRDILALRPGVDSVALPLLAEQYDEQEPALSPDGRWLAYISNETGSFEVYVRPFPDVNTGKWQVSTNGGIMPVWAHSGRELFFWNVSGLVAAQVDTNSGFQVGEKQRLFTLTPEYRSAQTNTLFGVSPDDQRFLMARAYQGDSQEAPERPFVLVNNFFEELRARVGG
jgi:Tol biopolymer transport system component